MSPAGKLGENVKLH